MQTTKLTADSRPQIGKGAARAVRGAGRIPAVAYGPQRTTTHLAVSPKEITTILGTELGRNTMIELSANSEKLMVLIADYQYHPVTRELLHVDFREVKEDVPFDFEVPFEATGKAKGVVDGGILNLVYRKLPVRCLPAKVPAKLTHDVTELLLEHSVPAKDVKVPEGVVIRLPPEQTVVAVVAPKKVVEEEAAAAAAAAPGAPGAPAAAGAAGAPAAGAAAPAAGAAPGKGAAAAPAAAAPAKGGKPAK